MKSKLKNISQRIKNLPKKLKKVFLALILFSLSLAFLFFFKNLKDQANPKFSTTWPTSSYLYQSKSKGFAVYLGSRQEKNLPQVNFKNSSGASINFKPLDLNQANSLILSDEKSITYQEVMPGIDISYSLIPRGFKEEIIIKTEMAKEKIINDKQILFETTVNNALLQKETNEKGDINFIDPQSQEILFYIPKPFMIDSQGKRSEKINFEFIPNTNDNEFPQSKFIVKLIPDLNWLKTASLPIIIDPSVELSILNVHSHPKTGDNWEVSFQTQGTDDLTITPLDQATIDDMDFVSLTCDGQEKTPQILANDILFYPDWNCPGTAKVIHFVRLGGTHNLEFRFGDQTAIAHNSPDTEILRPNADGDIIELENSPEETQIDNWSYVDEEVADDLSTSLTVNDNNGAYLDLYQLPSHSASGIISKITIHTRIINWWLSEFFPIFARIAIKTGGTVYYSGELTTAFQTWENKSYEWDVNPKTGVAWSWSDIDNLQIGIELHNEEYGGYTISCTQLYIEVDYTIPIPPISPTALLTEGAINPANVTDTTPEFSAVYNDDEGDIANKYQIQVNTDSLFVGTSTWDSGVEVSMDDCTQGDRCSDISFGGASTILQWGQKYFWRIKFWDDDGSEGDWSTENAYFTMIPIYEPTACMIDDSGQPSQLVVNWSDNTALETGYRIERSVDNGEWTLLSTETANTVSKTDDTVSSDHTYSYRIQAVSDNGNSQWCSTSQVDYSKGNLQMQGIIIE